MDELYNEVCDVIQEQYDSGDLTEEDATALMEAAYDRYVVEKSVIERIKDYVKRKKGNKKRNKENSSNNHKQHKEYTETIGKYKVCVTIHSDDDELPKDVINTIKKLVKKASTYMSDKRIERYMRAEYNSDLKAFGITEDEAKCSFNDVMKSEYERKMMFNYYEYSDDIEKMFGNNFLMLIEYKDWIDGKNSSLIPEFEVEFDTKTCMVGSASLHLG